LSRREIGASKQANQSGALNLLKVLEVGGELGWYAGKLLAELGADVVRVEPPGGDALRRHHPTIGAMDGHRVSVAFYYFNTSKRAITLDLHKPEARDMFLRLVAVADVLLDSSQGELEGLGLQYEELQKANPRLIITSITPFGREGPYSHLKACDLLIQAMGGIAFMSGFATDPPVYMGDTWQSAFLAGGHGCIGTLLALHHRHLTGEGQTVDISAQEAVAIALDNAIGLYEQLGQIRGRSVYPSPTGSPGVGLYECADGWVTVLLSMVPRRGGSGSRWKKTLDWMQTEGFKTNLYEEQWQQVLETFSSRETLSAYLDPSQGEEVLRQHIHQLEHVGAEIRRFFRGHSKATATQAAQSRGIIVAPVNTAEDLAKDVHLRERGFFVTLHDEALQRELLLPGAPYRLSRTPWKLKRPPPDAGQHDDELLAEWLNLGKVGSDPSSTSVPSGLAQT
jgi:benzylsuccinate CoA-transferase BbsE subunit